MKLLRKLHALFRKEKLDGEMAEEMREHLELQAAENMRRGMNAADAHYAAQRTFGGVEQLKERARDERGFAWLAQGLQDLRYAARQLRHARGFAVVVVLSLAVGIGATIRVFRALDQTLLRTLPVAEPEALMRFRWLEGAKGARPPNSQDGLGETDPATGRRSSDAFSQGTFEAFRERSELFTEIFAFTRPPSFTLEIDGRVDTASGQTVSGNYHVGLGVAAGLGRALRPEDDRPDATPVVVISHACWLRRFDGAADIVGKTIRVNRVTVTVIGVMPQNFVDPIAPFGSPMFTFPFSLLPLLEPEAATKRAPTYWWVRIMGRLRPGATIEQATASLQATFEASTEGALTERNDPPRLLGLPGGRGVLEARRNNAQPLYVLGGLTVLLLLAACANVANLLLARGAARRREIAVRLTLGASRGRLIRQLLMESLLLALLGAGLGLLFAQWSQAIPATGPTGGEGGETRAFLFAGGVALVTSLIFGLAPALRATRLDLVHEFQGGARLLGQRTFSRLARLLMVVQVALSLVLLVGAGLFARTLRNLEAVEIGFNRNHLLLFALNPAAAGYSPAEFAAVHARTRAALAAVPGVRSVSYAFSSVLAGSVGVVNRVEIPGRESPPGGEGAAFNPIAPDFLATLEIPLLLGRTIDERDMQTNARVAVINETFARKFFGDTNPLGRHLVLRGERVVVGVARDVRHGTLRAPTPPTVYLPFAPDGAGWANFVVRTTGEPGALVAALREALRGVSPDLPMISLRTQEKAIEGSLGRERMFARLSGLFGGTALALACIGLYGLLSYGVARRTGEIGLRMALGAVPRHIVWLLLGESFALVSAGIALGVVATIGTVRLVASQLYGLSPTDPPVYVGGALVLLVVAVLACWLPARRATKIDPMVALRRE